MEQVPKQQPTSVQQPVPNVIVVQQVETTNLHIKLYPLSRFQIKFGTISVLFGIINIILALTLPCYWTIDGDCNYFYDGWATFGATLFLGSLMLLAGTLNRQAYKFGSVMKMKVGMTITIISVLVSITSVTIEVFGAIMVGDFLYGWSDYDPSIPWSGATQAYFMMYIHCYLGLAGILNFIVGLVLSIKILCGGQASQTQAVQQLPGFNPYGGYSNPNYQGGSIHTYNNQQLHYQQQYGFQQQNQNPPPPPYYQHPQNTNQYPQQPPQYQQVSPLPSSVQYPRQDINNPLPQSDA